MIHRFRECPQCAAKAGSPVLCASCIHNRDTIGELEEVRENLLRKMQIISQVTMLD